MMPFEKKLLNSLVDSYERSSLARAENKVAVHISFLFRRENIPEYFDESSGEYEVIHAVADQLEKRGFIEIKWRSDKKGTL